MKLTTCVKKLFERSSVAGGKTTGGATTSGQTAGGLEWIDEFINNVRPYIFVREEDNLLIKRPNQAQQLNAQGVVILKTLLKGKSIHELLDRVGREPERIRDIALFMFEVKRFLEGSLDETNLTTAAEVKPFEMPFSTLPVLSEVAVTYRCNLKCSFCYAGCNCTTNPIGDNREMTASEIRTVLKKIYREAKVPTVSFTGGEPTLRPDLADIVRYANRLGMRTNLITNGTRITAELAVRLAEAGLDSAQVSLEGVTAETHERITGTSGSFIKSVSAVDFLKTTGILVHTNTTINRNNLHECLKMPDFVRRQMGNDRFSMNLIVPAGSAALSGHLWVRYSELGPYLKAIASASERHNVEFMWYSPTPMCVFNPVAHGLGNKGCSACDGLISVGANGDVVPCSSYNDTVGNLLEQGIDEIWRSKSARRYREKFLAHPVCRDCEDFAVCNGACPLYWRQIGFDELKQTERFEHINRGRKEI